MESLYRKYRPLTFESVVGQQHIVSTLEHAVAEGRLSHAYLFCGPRGTGKTTMARILAKALLCEKSDAARAQGASGCMPDGACPECEAIAAGTHPDVYELDAASRTGVDNVREEIINSVSFAPVRGAYKVYIIDEVHMLTTAAFNALLKTLEEPPSHVVFRAMHHRSAKILETILSRCQRFDFHRISNEDIVGRLRISASGRVLSLTMRPSILWQSTHAEACATSVHARAALGIRRWLGTCGRRPRPAGRSRVDGPRRVCLQDGRARHRRPVRAGSCPGR